MEVLLPLLVARYYYLTYYTPHILYHHQVCLCLKFAYSAAFIERLAFRWKMNLA